MDAATFVRPTFVRPTFVRLSDHNICLTLRYIDICPTKDYKCDICPTYTLTGHLSDRYLSNLTFVQPIQKRTYVQPQRLSNMTFFQPDICPKVVKICLPACLSVLLSVRLSVRPFSFLFFLLRSSNPMSEWRLDAQLRSFTILVFQEKRKKT